MVKFQKYRGIKYFIDKNNKIFVEDFYFPELYNYVGDYVNDEQAKKLIDKYIEQEQQESL